VKEQLGSASGQDNSLRDLLPDRWWEKVAGLKIMTLKKGRSYGHELSLDPGKASRQLDEIVAQGFQAIEIFAPAAGRYAYSGLDTTDHYRIDPELGTMDDFRRLVRIAHSKGLAVVIFPNLGYFSVEAADWITACTDPDSEQARWFSWADRPDAPPPGAEDSQFYVDSPPPGDRPDRDATWGWQYSERAGRYYWSRWKAQDQDGNDVGLPQTDWTSEEWPRQAGKIVRFWMDTGIDGLLMDAPLFYTGLTWEKNCRSMTDIVNSYGNVYVQPEGGREVAWLTEGGYNSIQDYGMRLWGGVWQQNSIVHALETGDPRPIEESLRNYHDQMEAVGAVLYHNVHQIEDPAKRHLERATVAALGDILAHSRWVGEPDAEESWILRTRRTHPALHPLGHRLKLPTRADDKHYAFVRTAPDGLERVLVILNFQPTPQVVQVDTSGLYTPGFVDLRNGEYIAYQNSLPVSLPAYGYQFCRILAAPRSRHC
jgi:hypothetical protein